MKKALVTLPAILASSFVFVSIGVGQLERPYKSLLNSATVQELRFPSTNVKIVAGPRIDYNLADFQFVSDDVGVAVGTGAVVGHYPIFYKTTNSGESWSSNPLRVGWHPRSIAFRNEKEGFITNQDVTGCPAQCLNRNVVLKTSDGGESWQYIDYADHKGVFQRIEFDSKGNAYGLLSLMKMGSDPSTYSTTASILKSTDFGETWSLFYQPDKFDYMLGSFVIRDDLLFLPTDYGSIIELDANGANIAEYPTGYKHIQSLTVASDGAVFANVFDENDWFLIRSIDRGKTWELIREKSGWFVSARTADNLTIIDSKPASLPITDVTSYVGAILVSSDGGDNWSQSEWVHSLSPRQIRGLGTQYDYLMLNDRVLSIEYAANR